MTKNRPDNTLERDQARCAKSYKASDDGRWASAYFAHRIVGRYARGATIDLSKQMGVSTDTIENLSHAYELYQDLRDIPKYRQIVRQIRKLPFVYYGYFRFLYQAKKDFKITNDEIMGLLYDVAQAEGDLHQSDMESHIRNKLGKERDWKYFAGRALKEIEKTLQQPDLPRRERRQLIHVKRDLSQKVVTFVTSKTKPD